MFREIVFECSIARSFIFSHWMRTLQGLLQKVGIALQHLLTNTMVVDSTNAMPSERCNLLDFNLYLVQ